MLELRCLILPSFFLTLGCVAPADTPASWQVKEEQLQLMISNVFVSATKVSITLEMSNSSDYAVCFDGTVAFPFSLQLVNSINDAPLSWSNGPVIPLELIDRPRSRQKYVLEPNQSRRLTIELERPITGPYFIPSVSSFYKQGDLLLASSMQIFYDCSYPSESAAKDAGRSVVVVSPPSEPFRED